MEITNKNIEEYIRRFMEGETTNAEEQAILRMKHIDGFEVEEIARLTGSTVIAVRTNLSRARKKVREQFMKRNKEWK